MTADPSPTNFPHRHLLGIEGLSPGDIGLLLDVADGYVVQNRRADKKTDCLRGRTLIASKILNRRLPQTRGSHIR
jgi:aspartate carbamoyltransferase catalytic subunit